MSLVIEAPAVPLRTDDHGVIRVGKTRVPNADIVRVQDGGLEGADDTVVLDTAASEDGFADARSRLLLYERVERGLPMPVVFEIALKVHISVVIEDILPRFASRCLALA